MEECVFCKIVKGDIPCHKIYENEKVIAFLDINPWSRGHTLIAPKAHFKDIFEVDEEVLKDVVLAVKKVSQLVKERLGAVGVNVLQNNGKAAGQLVPHIHFHVIPRYGDNSLQMYHQSDYKGDDLEEVAKVLSGQNA